MTSMTYAPTENQLKFLSTLLEERDGGDFNRRCKQRIASGTLTKKDASDAIDWLLRRDKVAKTEAQRIDTQMADVPAGRYAIVVGDSDPDGDGSIVKFYKIDRPTEGRWAGRTFVNVQASDEFYPVRNTGERSKILAEIAKDPQAAMLRYGVELGSCGHCGRTLTNEESRARGIGPICAGKMGW